MSFFRHPLHFFANLLGFKKDDADMSDGEIPENYINDDKINILRYQLEYYFSGFNLENDKSLLEEIKKDENRYVPIEYLLNCNRVKQMGATAEDVVKAASSSLYIEGNELGVRSKQPFVSDKERAKKSIRITGFDEDVPDFLIYQFLTSIFKEIGSLVMLLEVRQDQYVFSGNVLCELNSAEEAQEAAQRNLEKDGKLYNVEILADFNQRNSSQRKPKSPKKSPNRH